MALAGLAAVLAVPLMGEPAPPTVDAPLFDCAKALAVRGYDSGATLRVYVGGVLRGTKAGASSYSAWVDLTAPLQGNQAVEATQEVGGVESARSIPVVVAAPNPASLIHFEPPVEACAQGGYVHNDLAGKISIDSSKGDQLAFAGVDHPGDFPTLFSRPLVAGESLAVTVDHCRLGAVTSAPNLVSHLYTVHDGGHLPTPLIDTDTAIECLKTVLVRDVVPGAQVRVFNGAALLGQTISTSDQAWVDLSAAMVPAWQLRAQQELCKGALSKSSPTVEPTPLDALVPPVVEGPIWEGQQHVWLDMPIPAPATITVDGTAIRHDIETSGHSRLNVEKPFVAGQKVSAFYKVCNTDSPPAPPVEVLAPPKVLPPPLVGLPLFACTNAVSVSGVVDQAEVVVLIDDQEIHHGFAAGGSTSFVLGQTLQAGQQVSAYQRIGPLKSAQGPKVVVFEAPDLKKPRIQVPLKACQRSVVVEDVLPGAWVTVYVNGAPFAYATASSAAVEVPTLPLVQGWKVEARQELNVCKKSNLSDPVPVGPPTLDHIRIRPEIVEPLLACQTAFEVRALIPGTELDVFVDDLWKKRVPVSSSDVLVGIQPPLHLGQKVRVQPAVCGDPGLLSDEAVVQLPALAPPKIQEPVFQGDPSVVVTGAPFGSLVRIYNGAKDQIGAGMGGGGGGASILLSQPARAGDLLTATASLCGQESDGALAFVRPNRPSLPHDAMVSWFWLDAGNKAQALLQVTGRNVYKGSIIRINGQAFPTFPMAQIVPDFGHDPSTLGTPVDTIGSVMTQLFFDASGVRFAADQKLLLSVDNPDGSSGALRRFNKSVGDYTARYDLAASMATLDSDGDGLTDVAESPGATPDLAAIGANPLRKNIFVEVDWMVAADHTHEPNAQSFDRVRSAFASALTLNPDSSQGVDLFVDMGQNGGQGGDKLPHFNTIALHASDQPDVLFQQFYDNNFAKERKGLFHYCIIGHMLTAQHPNSSGIGDILGDRFILAMTNGGDLDDSDWITDVAAVFIHELGHNLNLRHGGDTNTNGKPNYLSIMNYLYQNAGISTNCDTSPDGVHDYSYGLLADLDETNLDEVRGICDGVPQDWNGNLAPVDTGVTANINGDHLDDYGFGLKVPWFNEFRVSFPSARPLLHDHCDWCFWTALGLP